MAMWKWGENDTHGRPAGGELPGRTSSRQFHYRLNKGANSAIRSGKLFMAWGSMLNAKITKIAIKAKAMNLPSCLWKISI
ncbi:hypothetical protein [Paenibacillus thiaminolyticus]|uniref:hypothetical protein n=1 Tax=Paenibacillus thiaminolyticus TaxID=49283 RepID=UPI0011C4A5C8|nr:hypothetical protein [Paenibacillus thiaminolyticus]